MLKKFVIEINEAFQTNNFPVLDTLHIFDPRYIPKSIDEATAKDVTIVYEWYEINKFDVYDGLKEESAALIGFARETFLNEFTSIEIKTFENSRIIEDDLKKLFRKKENLHQNKKAKAKDVKEIQTYIEKLELQKNCPVSLEEAYQFAKDVYPNIAQILKILLICPASGAVVERGFSLMNMQMNK